MTEDSLKVFVVDDDAATVDWLVRNVEWEVYDCEVAGSATEAAEALRYMKEHTVDLLLTDVCMPGVSGLELIRQAKEEHPRLYVIVISAFDKFEYVKEAFQYGIIDYCLKPIDVNELYGCLKSAEAAYSERQMRQRDQDMLVFRNSIFQRLINGEGSAARLEEQCALADIALDQPLFQVALLDMHRLEQRYHIPVANRFAGKGREGYYCFFNGRMDLVFLFWGGRGCDSQAERAIGEILRLEGIRDAVTLYIGRPLKSYRQIAESYQACCDFQNAWMLFSGREVRIWQYPYEKYLGVLKDRARGRLAGSLNLDDLEGAMEAIREIAGSCSGETKKRAEVLCLAVFLVKNVRVAHPHRRIPAPRGSMEAQSSSERMLTWLEEFCRGMREGTDGEEGACPQVNRALRKIGSDYGDGTLSLKGLAAQWHISAAYLGKLFKEQTGEYFNDYLLRIRIEEAKRLLLGSRLRMGEIASEVGFSNQSYFNKMFRKSCGISPAEYRRQCSEEHSI